MSSAASSLRLPARWAQALPYSRKARQQKRTILTHSRGYDDALQKLSLIASNRRITSLFSEPPSSPTTNLNAQAIPEMLTSLRQAGYTPKDLTPMRHIHVAGTKGKGSVCAFATSLLLQQKDLAGPVGTYTSPHLISPRERIAIDGQPVDRDVFAAAVSEIWDRFTEVGKTEMGLSDKDAAGAKSKPFYFRFMTILAWHIFLKLGVRDVVMECGIGGEYDATNVLPAEAVSAAVITQLGIDHVAMLGDTVEKIAWHKSGILKPGVKGFTRKLDHQPAVMEVLRQRAQEKNAQLIEVDDALLQDWQKLDGKLKGDFQKHNQILALLAVKQHLGLDSDPPASLRTLSHDMTTGLREARLRGRCEIVEQEDVTWYLDGAHTKESLEQVGAWTTETVGLSTPLVLIFNAQERDAAHLLEQFLASIPDPSIFKHALFTRNEQDAATTSEERDTDVQEVAAFKMQELVPSSRVQVFDNIQDTVTKARELAKENAGKILVTGSLHLVGGILQAIEPGKMT